MHQSNPDNATYNIGFSWMIFGPLNVRALERSIDAIVQRHEILRTTFPIANGLPYQKINDHSAWTLKVTDLRSVPEAQREEHAKRFALQTAIKPYDLSVGPLFHAQLFVLSNEQHLLLIAVHHIIFDGASLGVFFEELRNLYEAFLQEKPASLPDLPIQYADYTVWQLEQSEGEAIVKQLNYWKEQLAGELPILEMPADRPRPAVQTYRGAFHRFEVKRSVVEALRTLEKEEHTTSFSIYLAAFKVLLFRYTRQDDLIVGTLARGRNLPELGSQIGFFVNSHALRTFMEGDLTFRDLLYDVFENWLNAIENQDVPFDKLVEALKPGRNLSHSPIFQVLFSFGSMPANGLELSGLQLKPVLMDLAVAKFDLTLDVDITADGAQCSFEYNTDLFDGATMGRMAAHFCALLHSVSLNPSQEIRYLSLLPEAERQQIHRWNSNEQIYPKDRCIQDLFETQARECGGKIALVDADKQFTYEELNARSNQLAWHLRSFGVGPDALVGLCLERSADLVVAILGILKAGGAYVPIDPTYPKDRQIFTLEDSGAALLITSSRQLSHSPELRHWVEQGGVGGRTIICLDTDREAIAARNGENPPKNAHANNLAYVLFTSGSTGKPKGVAIEHRSVVAFAYWAREIFSAEEFDGVLFATSVCFDLSVFELLVTLAWGGKVIISQNALALATLPARNEVHLINTVPSAMAELLRIKALPASVQTVNLAGELLPTNLVDEIYAHKSVQRVFDLYGPTETTTYSTFTLRKQGEPANIGRPLANEQVYILDDCRQIVPIGVPGELYIAGAGLARGYLNRGDLTNEKFVPNPFSSEDGARMYRTGDLARYRPDGTIEYLGRLDNQVKIRGFRIELGEVETVLRSHPNVQDAVAIAREIVPGEKRLVAYVVAKGNKPSDSIVVKQFIGQQLPEFMIPQAFVWLEALPLTPNGKVDRRALPTPENTVPECDALRIAPRDPVEQTIARIWQEALGVSKVGIQDNFFDLGGHSLLLARVHHQLNETFAKQIPLVEMFRHPTIAALSRFFSGETEFHEEFHSKGKSKREDSKRSGLERIAIVGMAGRFPGASSAQQLWQNLCNGVESIFRLSDEELVQQGVPVEEIEDPNYVKAGTALDYLEEFDAGFFGFNPKEAEILDPQHRIFLETAWEALEDAGCNPAEYPHRIGVYAGSSVNSYASRFGNRKGMAITEFYQGLLGNDKDFLPTRVSYKLNLRGPSFAVQSACATSLVAVQLACESLLAGRCEMALAGGVCANQPQRRGYLFQEGMILAPDGHCRAFDAKAQGTTSGMGVGIVVLKRLSDAVADGDTIHAVILGGAINNDGSDKVGYTAPSISGQANVIKMAHEAAQVDPESISFIEAHGTGTPMGDPIEIAALTEVFRTKTEKKQFCAVGSIKSNLGHLDVAAGVTGLIKTVMALKHRSIPPTLHFETPNPKIQFEQTPFYVNASLQEWKTDGGPRRAGVSAFGIGGTNVHVVLEEAPVLESSAKSRSHQLLMLSARTDSALESAVGQMVDHLKKSPANALPDVVYTLQTGRKHFEQRCFVIAGPGEAGEALADSNRLSFSSEEPRERKMVFLFTGQGAQHFRMAWDLYQHEKLFRKTVDQCAEILKLEIGSDIRTLLFHSDDPEAAGQQLNQTAFAQPALFTIEYALARLWISWGIHPEAMLGHSIGEYVAACVAGVFSLEDALRLVAERGRLMQGLPGGSMLVVPLSEKEIQPFLNDRLALAASNGPCLNVVSGEHDAIAKLEQQLAAEGLNCKRLHTSHAFHSPMMEPILETFTQRVSQVQLNAPRLKYISNLTGTWIEPAQATDPSYWAKHLRNAVRFSPGIRELLKDPDRVFLEAGPGQTLAALTKLHVEAGAPPKVFSSLRHPKEQISDERHILTTLGQLWLLGARIDWAGFYAEEKRRRVPLPTYPFQRQRYWFEEPKHVVRSKGTLFQRNDFEKWFYASSWKRSGLDHTAAEKAAEQRVSWLLFIDPCGLGANLARQLKELGQLAAVVSVGKSYEKKSNDTYVINPGEPKDYRALFESLSFLGRLPTRIVHLWSVTPERKNSKPGGESIHSSLDKNFYSLLYLAQTIGEQASDLHIDLKVISNQMQEVTGQEMIVPEKAVVLGPCRVISQEYENVQCSSIDVVLPDSASKGEKFNEMLLDEIFAQTRDVVIAHRGAHRWVECFEPTGVPMQRSGGTALRRNGVYLITGGLGGIGLAIAEHLAQTVGARLVLITRTPLPSRSEWKQWIEQHEAGDLTTEKIRKIESLEGFASEVRIINADVTNEQEMKRIVNETIARFGSIHGVIHAAGIAGGGIMQIKTRQAADRVLAAKVHGTIALGNALAEHRPDFVVLCSSVSGFLGGMGQVDYCAANAFLDAYARRHASRNFISVNWYAWQEVGMAVNTKVPEEMKAERALSLKVGIRPREGGEAFSRILNQCSPQIIVSPEDVYVQIERHQQTPAVNEEAKAKDNAKKYARPQIASNYLAPRNDTEKSLVEIWQQVLGIEKVGVRDDFFKLGGHSLLALTVFAKIKKLTGKEIPVATLFETPTIEKLSAVVGGGASTTQTEAKPIGRSNLIVPIKPTGTRPPFFCIHGVGGAVIEYSHLASYVDAEQPFYGIQAQGLDGKEAWLKTIEEMATRYIQEMKRVQPTGPYSLGGSSFGGIVAYEMAQQLHANGEVVTFLAFFDSYGKDYPIPLPSQGKSQYLFHKTIARFDMHFSNLRMLEAREWAGYVREKLGKVPVRVQRKMKQLKKDVRFLFLPRVLRNQFKWTGDDGGDLWHFKLPQSYTQVATANYRSCLNYRHKPYPGKAVLFRAGKQPAGILEDRTNGWGTLIQGGLEIIEVPGYHGAIVREPLVRKLGVEFNAILNKNCGG